MGMTAEIEVVHKAKGTRLSVLAAPSFGAAIERARREAAKTGHPAGPVGSYTARWVTWTHELTLVQDPQGHRMTGDQPVILERSNDPEELTRIGRDYLRKHPQAWVVVSGVHGENAQTIQA